MKRIREAKKPEGARCFAPGFGHGTVVKEGPEQSLVIWDDEKFHQSTGECYTPNSWFRKEGALPPTQNRSIPKCEECGAGLKDDEEEFGFCAKCLEAD